MKLLSAVKINFLQWREDPKYLTVLLFLGMYFWMQIHGFVAFARDMGCTMTPWLLVFLPSGTVILPIMLGYALLISDAPFRNGQQQFVLLRTGKRTWLWGQILYLLILSVLFPVLLWILSWIFMLPALEWSLEWGPGITTAAVTGNYGGYSWIAMEYGCMKNATPLEATLWVMAVMAGVCFLLALIAAGCNLWLKRGVGPVAVSALSAMPVIVIIFAHQPNAIKKLLWISPVSWMDRSLMGHTEQGLPPMTYGLVMPAVLSVILCGVLVGTIHKCNLETEEA